MLKRCLRLYRIFLAVLACHIFVPAADALPPKRVLVLYSYEQDRPANLLFDHYLRATFQAGATEPLEFYPEYLDVTRFPEEHDRRQLLDFYQQKYAVRKMDLIITVNVPALDFIVQHGDELFPGVPIVFSGVEQSYVQSLTLPSQITGAVTDLDLTHTLRSVLALQPDTKHVVMVAGTSEMDQFHAVLAQKAFEKYTDRLDFTYLSNFTMDELLTQVAELPPKTIIFYLSVSEDQAGNTFTPQEALSRITQVANVPVYSFSDTYFGYGIVGGDLVSFEAMGTTAAEIGLRILHGESPANIPISEAGANLLLFDWRQLHRWGLREQDLPPGSIVRYKEFSLWEQHKWQIIGGIVLCLIEAGLICALVFYQIMRKRAEAALRENEQKLKDAQKLGRMGHWEFDLNTRTIIWSEEVFILYERDPALGPPTPDEEATSYSPEQARLLREYSQQVIATGQELAYDLRAQLPGDRTVFFSALMRPVKNKDDQVVKLFGTVQDITERKQTENALRESEERFRHAFEYAAFGVALLSPDGHFLEVNQAICDIFGYSAQEITTKTFIDLTYPDDRDIGIELFQNLLTGKQEYGWLKKRYVHKDGHVIWALLSTSVIRDPQRVPSYLISQIQDITERKRAEEALRASAQQYRLLIEHAADGIGIIQDRRMVFVNEALADMLGYTVAQLLGKTPVEFSRGAYKTYFENMTHLREHQETEPHWHILEFVVTRDTQERWMEGRYSDIVWEGQPAVLITMRDVTERKVREEENQKQRQHLLRENIRLRAAMKERYRFKDIIGKSLAMQQVYERILNAAVTDASVLLSGESGTGKDLIAQTIHALSKRRKKAFVPVNCGSIPESLFEREFFGHRKGAFTGALRDTPGLFDAAHQGTLFLDEVGELTLSMQVKLLRAIEGSGYTPVGAQQVKYADVRIIAATNKNLPELVQRGDMRQDFFYRLNVVPITVPPLRERSAFHHRDTLYRADPP